MLNVLVCSELPFHCSDTWWTFRPEKKYLAPPPAIPQFAADTLPAPQPLPGEPPPPWDFQLRIESLPPSRRLGLPLPTPREEKKIRNVHQVALICSFVCPWLFGRAPKYRTKGCSRYWRPKFTTMQSLKCYKNQCSRSWAVSGWVWTPFCVILWGWLVVFGVVVQFDGFLVSANEQGLWVKC